jgi:hypothetical protein
MWKADGVRLDALDQEELLALEEDGRDERLDEEHAVFGEPACCTFEAADLVLLRCKQEDGVADRQDQRITRRDLDGEEITRDRVDALASRLRPQLFEHSLRCVDAVHFQPALRKRGRAARRAEACLGLVPLAALGTSPHWLSLRRRACGFDPLDQLA